MEELFNNMIANVWDGGVSGIYENPLSYDMIEESVGRACDFFHIEHPESVEPGHTTAVSLGDTGTYGDEILFFNRLQLEDMGITGQDGLDLVMTHEGTHIALQDMDTGFNCYQEELCCDYMAGVRAGLNGIDPTQLENSLANLPQGLEHPVGTLRVDAVEQGIAFAHNYMLTHDIPPTFNECLEDFKSGSMHGVFELEHLKSEMHSHECCMLHYQKALENEPDSERLKNQFHQSELQYNSAKNAFDEMYSGLLSENRDTLHEYSSDVANEAAKVESCQQKVNSLYSKLNSAKSKYGTNSDEYRNIKNEYDRAQTALSNARDDYKKAVQYAHRTGSL